ncbi:MAG: hypothetical protein H5T66_00550 [Chloroflexi bacterium]|nr:hypothetical protein [Chloroflexota bacterium]
MPEASEQLQILKMVEAGQISADEALRLLRALEDAEQKEAEGSASAENARWLRVRVTDLATGKNKVNVNIPISLVDVGLQMGAKFGDLDPSQMNRVAQAVKSGLQGKVIDVEDAEEQQRVEIFVE